MTQTLSPAAPADWPAIRALLDAASLPTADLQEDHIDRFLVASGGGTVVGCVAVEPYGEAGLLRSLAVAPEARGAGLGGRLAEAAEARARDAGLRRLVLLTTTAAPFFEDRGWMPLDRADVPAAVRRSSEFTSMCPASAVCLGKSLFP